jgi:A/G-specific adenine glycosylase
LSPLAPALLRWYPKHRRDLPWRKTRDPYRILVSEIMLQQTQVQTVIPYYRRWLIAFPDFQTLARAPLNQVLKLWEGLGYYSRARNFHALAKWVVKDYQGRLPDDEATLRSLPGIGRYTAGAVLSIAFRKSVPLVDGNVMRVFSRYFCIRKNISLPATQKTLWTVAEKLVPAGNPGDYNQALMELGATICTPRRPNCPRCPLKKNCKALRLGLQEKLPVKKKKERTPHFHIGAGVIWHQGKILISQRPLKGLLGGLWEFPGGKQEPGESLPETVRREIEEELGIQVEVGKKSAEVDHAYSHFKITLHAYHCAYKSGNVRALGVKAWRWVRPPELKKFAFPAADQPIIQKLLDTARSVRAGGS